MPRNLDLVALRSFVAVADTGGVTRAAGVLNLTQSAVSMQLKRLEEAVGIGLLDRSGRAVALTTAGEQLLSYARRMIDLNDQAVGRLSAREYEGEMVFGVPHDIIYPAIPHVLRQFAAEFPRIKLQLLSSYTLKLKKLFAEGKCDLIMTTEDRPEPGGEVLIEEPLIWIGAPGGSAWRERPLRLAFESDCVFRQIARDKLDRSDIPWELAVEAGSARTIEASVSADLAITIQLQGTETPQVAAIPHGGALPDLGSTRINMYSRPGDKRPAVTAMAEMVRSAYRMGGAGRWAPAKRPTMVGLPALPAPSVVTNPV
ncbi:MAG: LysR family transcriptional regulator [Pseudomonadota bacterium]